MPSQISLRTTPDNNGVQVGHKTVVSRNSEENDMKAAARTVGSLIITSHKSMRKPHSMVSINLNTFSKTENSDGFTAKSGPRQLPKNGTTTPFTVNMNDEVNCHAARAETHHMNGTLGPVPVIQAVQCNSSSPKTEGEHSDHHSSCTDESNSSRLMCPDLAVKYTSNLIGKRSQSLALKQKSLERRVASLQRKVHFRQLHLVHSHACKQLNFSGQNEAEDIEETSASSLTSSDCSVVSEGDLSLESRIGSVSLPIQVDGASDDIFLPSHHTELEEERMSDEAVGGRVRNEDSFSSLDSYASSSASSEVEEDGSKALTAQLTSLEGLLDSDLTEASSDEEGEEESADLQFHYR